MSGNGRALAAVDDAILEDAHLGVLEPFDALPALHAVREEREHRPGDEVEDRVAVAGGEGDGAAPEGDRLKIPAAPCTATAAGPAGL